MIAQYVETLCNAMGSYADTQASGTLASFRSALFRQSPDIVHIHGCWRMANLMVSNSAAKHGARVVFSPHGGLEPWIVRHHYWREKLPRLLLYQRPIAKRAYAVVAMGRMEAKCLKRLNYNPRMETVLNSLITEALTDSQMASEMHAIYRKVLDSNVWPLMEEQTKMAIRAFVKTGNACDERWIEPTEHAAIDGLTQDEWRKIALYAHQEGILDTVSRGIDIAGKRLPDIDLDAVPHYLPQRYSPAQALSPQGKDNNETFINAIKAMHKLYRANKLAIRHIVELDALIRANEFAEDKLADSLSEKHLLTFAGSAMKALADLTGLEEGLMPVAMRSGRKATSIGNRATQNLNIL